MRKLCSTIWPPRITCFMFDDVVIDNLVASFATYLINSFCLPANSAEDILSVCAILLVYTQREKSPMHFKSPWAKKIRRKLYLRLLAHTLVTAIPVFYLFVHIDLLSVLVALFFTAMFSFPITAVIYALYLRAKYPKTFSTKSQPTRAYNSDGHRDPTLSYHERETLERSCWNSYNSSELSHPDNSTIYYQIIDSHHSSHHDH